jgi:hypothetical protein
MIIPMALNHKNQLKIKKLRTSSRLTLAIYQELVKLIEGDSDKKVHIT